MNVTYPLPYPAEKLIPHRSSMLLVKNLDVYEINLAQSNFLVSNENMFVNDNGLLDSIVFVELLAQLAACHSGYEARLGKGIEKAGFLVGVRDFQINDEVRLGDSLILEASKTNEIEQVSFIDGSVHKNGVRIAAGLFKLWETARSEFKVEAPQKQPQPARSFDVSYIVAQRIAGFSLLHRALLEHLYSFEIAESKTEAKAQMYFTPDFIGFDGHFPDAPVFPGVMMLKLGVFLAELLLQKPLRVTSVIQAKFARVIFPQEVFQAQIKVSEVQGGYEISGNIRKADDLCAKFTLVVDDDRFIA